MGGETGQAALGIRIKAGGVAAPALPGGHLRPVAGAGMQFRPRGVLWQVPRRSLGIPPPWRCLSRAFPTQKPPLRLLFSEPQLSHQGVVSGCPRESGCDPTGTPTRRHKRGDEATCMWQPAGIAPASAALLGAREDRPWSWAAGWTGGWEGRRGGLGAAATGVAMAAATQRRTAPSESHSYRPAGEDQPERGKRRRRGRQGGGSGAA